MAETVGEALVRAASPFKNCSKSFGSSVLLSRAEASRHVWLLRNLRLFSAACIIDDNVDAPFFDVVCSTGSIQCMLNGREISSRHWFLMADLASIRTCPT